MHKKIKIKLYNFVTYTWNIFLTYEFIRNDLGLRMGEKLHMGLFEVNTKARMRVLPAAQLISQTMASTIKYLYEKRALKNTCAPLAASMIETVNSWFDVMNSRDGPNHQGVNNLKAPLGRFWDEQKEAIDKMSVMTEQMRVCRHQALLPFQWGVLMTNQSIIGLHE